MHHFSSINRHCQVYGLLISGKSDHMISHMCLGVYIICWKVNTMSATGCTKGCLFLVVSIVMTNFRPKSLI